MPRLSGREVWVVGLDEEVVEIYADPAGGVYRTVGSHGRGEELQSRSLAALRVSVAEVFGWSPLPYATGTSPRPAAGLRGSRRVGVGFAFAAGGG